MKYQLPIHPLLFAAYPLLALWANNVNEIEPGALLRAFVAVFLGVSLLWALSWGIHRNRWKASVVTTLFVVLFFSYGHVLLLLQVVEVGGQPLGLHRYLTPAWAGVLIALLLVVNRIGHARRISSGLTVIGLVLLIAPAANLIRYQVSHNQIVAIDPEAYSGYDIADSPLNCEDLCPDIYYIILDGYARDDILSELYSIDDPALTAYLQAQGFYVADRSYANYNQTWLSLASSLNLTYLGFLAEEVSPRETSRKPLRNLVQESRVIRILKERGYTVVGYESGYETTVLLDTDVFLAPGDDETAAGYNEFEVMLIETSFLQAIFDLGRNLNLDLSSLNIGMTSNSPSKSLYDEHRRRVLFSLRHLSDFAGQPGNYFLFVHIISPHPPFIFGPNGEEINPSSSFTIADGSHFKGETEDYVAGYRDQITYLNGVLIDEIKSVLRKSETPPIIIIQGDHGPGSQLVWDSLEDTYLPERMAILNAYFLPGVDSDVLYESISPVNTFRLVFNQYFGSDYPIVSDRSYFALWFRPYGFIDVTEELP